MNQVESVAFWVEFITSIVGIVLSIVAIVFSILVDRRSSTISAHTIQSLQKIESAVERSSSDTRELIKAGWDKMLGSVDKAPLPTASESSAKEVAAGIAAELRSEIASLSANMGTTSGESRLQVEQLEKYLKNLEASLVAQLKTSRSDVRPSAKFEELLDAMRELEQPAYALLGAIRFHHLSKSQYNKLVEGRLGPYVLELRAAGLLVPVVHKTSQGSEPCYYMPPGISKLARAIFQILPEPSEEAMHDIAAELERIGYINGDNVH